jgi:hypothetical protein
MGSIRFTTTLLARGPAAAVVLDDAQVAAVGEGAKRFPVAAAVNGYTWRTSVARMGGEFLLGLNRAVRLEAGVQAGDTVEVEIELDTAPREVVVPDALAGALAHDVAARAAFEALSYSTARSTHAGSTRPSATRRASDVSPRRSPGCARTRRPADPPPRRDRA